MENLETGIQEGLTREALKFGELTEETILAIKEVNDHLFELITEHIENGIPKHHIPLTQEIGEENHKLYGSMMSSGHKIYAKLKGCQKVFERPELQERKDDFDDCIKPSITVCVKKIGFILKFNK